MKRMRKEELYSQENEIEKDESNVKWTEALRCAGTLTILCLLPDRDGTFLLSYLTALN
jgi:hypothetical protein